MLVGAIRRGNLDQTREMLKDEPVVDLLTEDGMSILYLAVFKQQLSIIEYLLQRGADINLRNTDDLDTPLLLAFRREDRETIVLLTTSRDKLVSTSQRGTAGGGDLMDYLNDLASPAVPVAPADAIPLRASLSMRECSICFGDEDTQQDETTRIVRLERCGHACCMSCMSAYLQTSIEDQVGKISKPVIECFAKGCGETISYRDVERFAPATHLAKYQTRLTHAALRLMDDFAWCPKCESGGLITTPTINSRCTDVLCDQCPYAYCSWCRQDAHPNLTCAQKLEQVVQSDAYHMERLSAKALKKYTKPCPRCEAPTQRDGGCSHMTCRVCQFAWCWLCNGPYQPGRYTFGTKCPCE